MKCESFTEVKRSRRRVGCNDFGCVLGRTGSIGVGGMSMWIEGWEWPWFSI